MADLTHSSREEVLGLIEDAAKLWLAHDGLWFQAVEKTYGMDEAIKMDAAAWEQFTVLEAKRIMKRQHIDPGGGITALKRALNFRLYAYINEQELIQENDNKLIFRMKKCRVQEARQRKNLPDFPCKSVGLVEYAGFAQTIDSRIKTSCLCCPPDEHPRNYFCAWEFTLP